MEPVAYLFVQKDMELELVGQQALEVVRPAGLGR